MLTWPSGALDDVAMSRVPTLPPELEREIFELSFRMHRGIGVRLVLVARRVQVWIEPLLYEVVVLGYNGISKFMRAIDHKSPNFFSCHVKALCLNAATMDPKDTVRILSVCTGTVNLACWAAIRNSDALSRVLSSFQLKRLSIDLAELFGPLQAPDFTHPVFRNITHLELLDRCRAGQWDGLGLLPRLTHIAFDFWTTNDIASALPVTLASCKTLELLVLVRVAYPVGAHELGDIEGSNDPRVVEVSSSELIRDWESGVRGGSDIWVRAQEAFEENEGKRALLRLDNPADTR